MGSSYISKDWESENTFDIGSQSTVNQFWKNITLLYTQYTRMLCSIQHIMADNEHEMNCSKLYFNNEQWDHIVQINMKF